MNEQIGNKINDKTYIKLTPFKGFVLENFPFIEADFDAITNYQLICKIVEYLNNVISNQNTVQELGTDLVNAYNSLVDAVNLAINEFETDVTADINQFKVDVNNDFDEFTTNITTQFNNLKNYVDNFFDNNFPQMISDKLDEMAEDGTLENLLNDAAHLIKVYNTYADMYADRTNFTNGLKLQTLGYYEVGDGGNAIYKVIEENNNLVIKLVSDVNNILCHGVSLTDVNNNNHTIINNVLSTYKYAYCDRDFTLKNTLNITTDNCKLEFQKITYTGEDEAITINGQSILINGSTIISSDDGIRIGKTTLTNNCVININRISAQNNSVIMGGTAGTLNCNLHLNRLEYKNHGIYFDLTNSYVGQISLYNTVFADNSSLTENFAIYMDCSDNGMTGLDIYNISLEGAKGGIYVTTSGTATGKFLEHLNVYGCRLAEFSTTNNHKALKLVSPSGGLDIEGEFHFDMALTSAFDFSEYNSWGQQFYKIEGKFLDRTLSTHQAGKSPLMGKEGTIRAGKLEICNPYYEYMTQDAGIISDYIIPTSRNLVLSGTATPNIKFNNSDYALTGLYTIYINTANINTINLVNSTGTVLRSYTVESGDTIMIYSNYSGGCQLNSWLIRPSHISNAN